MVQDLQADSQRWRQELQLTRSARGRDREEALAAYRGSQTHQSRQYYGPSDQPTYPTQPQVLPRPEGQYYDPALYGQAQQPQTVYAQPGAPSAHQAAYGQPAPARTAPTHAGQAIGREGEVYYQPADQRVAYTYPAGASAEASGQQVYYQGATGGQPAVYYYHQNGKS